MSMDTEVRFDGEVVIVTGGVEHAAWSTTSAAALEAAARIRRWPQPLWMKSSLPEARPWRAPKTSPRPWVRGSLSSVRWTLGGRVDGIVHNAAILRDAHFENVDDADYDDMMNVNLRGTFRTVQAVYRAMKDNGGGRILTGTSASGLAGAFGQVIYAATKMGVVGLTRSIAWEGMRYGIKANAIAPAAFDSRMYAEMNPEGDAALTGRPPDLEGVAGGRRIHGPVHRKPGDPAGVGTGSPQLPGHRRGLLRDGRLLLPVRHQPQRRRFARIGTHRRGRGGALR